MNRRIFFGAVSAPLGIVLGLSMADALAYDNPRRRIRTRLRVRRRIRRHAFIQLRFGRPFWVVPIGLAVGWELSLKNRVVVVRETRVVESDGVKTEVAVVQGPDGKSEQVEITREDTAENRRNLEGSVLDDSDTTTPAIEEVPRN
jgi:hypothetical protein